MYRVVLVDDERLIVEGLRKVIRWADYGCEVVGTAEDAVSGARLIREQKPQILFTDIRMPGDDGLTMLAALRSEFPDLQVAVLTGYRDFSYAQEAIRLGVTRFLLKPSRMDEIRESRKLFQPEHIQVVLTHTPLTEEYVRDMITWGSKEDYFSMRYAGLILAGHYNGGQWRLPMGRAIHVPELGWFPEDQLVRGLSYLNGIPQYISPGLGSDPHYEHQPGRLFNPPMLTLITLTRKGSR
jgi:ActR/RegA family two-component response regulator